MGLPPPKTFEGVQLPKGLMRGGTSGHFALSLGDGI